MKRSLSRRAAVSVLCLALAAPAFAGDSLFGKVTAVKSGVLVTFDYGAGQYDIRLIGIDVPGPVADKARSLVAKLVGGKNARIRFEYRTADGEMLARLFTADPRIGIKDVGLELVQWGLARRQPNFDYKYGELSTAEGQAPTAGRGIWAPTPTPTPTPTPRPIL
jgi:endonuclease YncB( thermonuclease family)